MNPGPVRLDEPAHRVGELVVRAPRGSPRVVPSIDVDGTGIGNASVAVRIEAIETEAQTETIVDRAIEHQRLAIRVRRRRLQIEPDRTFRDGTREHIDGAAEREVAEETGRSAADD